MSADFDPLPFFSFFTVTTQTQTAPPVGDATTPSAEEKHVSVLPSTLKSAFEEASSKTAESLRKEIEEAQKAQKADMQQLRREALKNSAQRYGKAEQEACARLLRAVISKDAAGIAKGMEGFQKSLDTVTAAKGGVTIPELVEDEIHYAARDAGVARKELRNLSMAEATVRMTPADEGATYWVDEGAAIGVGNPSFKGIDLVSKKLATILAWTSEFGEDTALSNPIAAFSQMVADNFAYAEDTQAFIGSGTPFTGLVNHADITKVSMASTKTTQGQIDFSDLKNLIKAVPTRYHNAFGSRAKFYGSLATLLDLTSITDDNNRPVVSPITNSLQNFVYGREFVITSVFEDLVDAAGNPVLLFGNGKCSTLGLRKGMTTLRLEEGTVGNVNFAEQDHAGLRVVERVGVATQRPEGFAVLQTAAS